MIDFKLFRALNLDKLDVETQYDRSMFQAFRAMTTRMHEPIAEDWLVLDEAASGHNLIEHPRLDVLVQSLRNKMDCLLVGASSSGKSTLGWQVGNRLMVAGYRVLYSNVGSLSSSTTSRALTSFLSLIQDDHRPTVIVLDDLQSGPSIARYLLAVIHAIRSASSLQTLSILAITWPSFAMDAAQGLGGARVVQISASMVRTELLLRHPDLMPSLATLEAIAGDDLLLWHLAMDRADQDVTQLSRAKLAERAWYEKTQRFRGDIRIAKVAVFVASVLGRYEFELSSGFLRYESGASQQQIDELCAARLLRRTGDRIVAGHRSLCTLLADWLARDDAVQDYFVKRFPSMQVADLVLSYIRALDGAEIWPVLRALSSQVGFKGSSGTTQRAGALADSWKAIDSLVERIEYQTAIDPTWGKTLSSALFAVEALCGVGKRDRARKSIEFMRAHWRLNNGVFYILGGTAERLDFDGIATTMLEEDALLGLEGVSGRQPASDVDLDRFHQTWAAGLILCSEATFGELSQNELDQMATAIEVLQSDDGSFYPRRVPWSTARVLMGLAKCGHTIYNSSSVKRACEWLLSSKREGGAAVEGVWPSGTGRWNTVLETTAMCASALVLAGVSPDDPRLIPAFDYLKGQKEAWISNGGDIDGAMSVEAYISLGGSWREFADAIDYLFMKARQEAFWGKATVTSKESFAQSCYVSVISGYLISTTWASLRAELPDFLHAFAVPDLPIVGTLSGVTSPKMPRVVSLPRQQDSLVAKEIMTGERLVQQSRSQSSRTRAHVLLQWLRKLLG